ncbi:hypothetical protein HBI04_176780 [Parastagonospora nodorum]|nr:hypothetical protein HBI03_187100 [Parastagonospora nodorum]KAH4265873.1 hypothetical protein HBI04_176780 [Parastagonospora nodorum]KAH5309087.1 hypothetical protein HBI50_169290 [Parastagonospora nodorum]
MSSLQDNKAVTSVLCGRKADESHEKAEIKNKRRRERSLMGGQRGTYYTNRHSTMKQPSLKTPERDWPSSSTGPRDTATFDRNEPMLLCRARCRPTWSACVGLSQVVRKMVVRWGRTAMGLAAKRGDWAVLKRSK